MASITSSPDTGVWTLSAPPYTASVCPARGAELCSLTFHGEELLHRALNFEAPPKGEWYGHGQLLFPAVGRHRDGSYTWEGQHRPMPLHGLAMGAPFPPPCAVVAGATTCSLRCEASEAALPAAAAAASFPFPFSLAVTFTLDAARGLAVRHEVTSRREAGNLPFAIGNHISFRFPFAPGGAPLPEQQRLWAAGRLRGAVAAQLELAPGSLLSGAAAPAPLFSSPGGCPLDAPGATDGVFAVGDGGGVTLDDSRLCVRVAQGLFPPSGGGSAGAACDWAKLGRDAALVVLWGAPPGAPETGVAGTGFLCVEPWLGGPDALNGGSGAAAVLQPGETCAWEFTVGASNVLSSETFPYVGR